MSASGRSAAAPSRQVMVKVRWPGVRRVIDRDMRALTRVLPLAEQLSPTLARQHPVRIPQEIWATHSRVDFQLDLQT